MTKKRVNIALEDDLHTKAKVIAVLTNRTLNDFFEKAIADAIEREKKILERIK